MKSEADNIPLKLFFRCQHERVSNMKNLYFTNLLPGNHPSTPRFLFILRAYQFREMIEVPIFLFGKHQAFIVHPFGSMIAQCKMI